jgi:hypothetical protein
VAADEPAQDLHGLLGYDVPAHRIRHRALQRVGARLQVLDGDGDASGDLGLRSGSVVSS